MSLNSCLRPLFLAVPLCLVLMFFPACRNAGLQTGAGPPSVRDSGKNIATSAPQRVSFASRDQDPLTGKQVVIQALLFKPPGADYRRMPAVVALHGCGGMYSTVVSRRDSLSIRHLMMADLLVSEGYIVLFPDSFRSRGFEEICTVENRKRRLTQRHRLQDAQGALAWLQRRDDVLPERVAVLGWSHGGSAVLATINAKQPAVADWLDRKPPIPYFRAGVAFYPGCNDSLKARGGYTLAAPVTLFIGGSDDWTAPGPCVDLAAKLSAAGEAATITVYPDTHHGFDGPSSQPRRRLEVPNGVNPGKGVTVAANPAARDDAYAKLKRYLRAHLGH
ncbi:MAG: dienelactone hydrolase family protein [Deltaproteobacteria bacterium]|nr:dienelactone hydrolase family protein [Deltaproteobacteria bacterium]